MIFLSKYPFRTLKTVPQASDNRSTGLLLQAGLIRQEMAGVYVYTTFGLRVLDKIKKIVREEMDGYGAFETLMPALSPKELWDTTGRWDSIDVFFHVPAANNKEYGLNSTHEEIVTPLMNEFIKSYKDLPVCVYQIQNKFRNEKRAKSGLLRGREFVMKDAYSFHADDAEFVRYYEGMKQVYMNVYSRVGLKDDTYIALADGGTFTDKFSHEFQVRIDIGEDWIYRDNVSGISYNKEVAPSMLPEANVADAVQNERQDIELPGVIGVEALEQKLGVPKNKTTKTLMFEADGRFIVAAVRGDYEINTLKLLKVLGCKTLELASEEKVLAMTGAQIGYAGIINLPEGTEVYMDDSIEGLTNFETGTNKTWFHSVNVNFGRDVKVPERFYDFKEAKVGDKNPETGAVYEVFRACEVGNIFPLETKFSKAFGLNFLDASNASKTPLMGCYGIGVSRLMGVVAEKFMDEKGLIWPETIAPFTHYMIVIGDHIEEAKKLASELEKQGAEVVIDDRGAGFGDKAKDADLLGIPNRIILSDKTLATGCYELKARDSDTPQMVEMP